MHEKLHPRQRMGGQWTLVQVQPVSSSCACWTASLKGTRVQLSKGGATYNSYMALC